MPAERSLAGEALVENTTEGEDVRSPVERLSARLLGAHVGSGSEDDAGLRPAGRGRRRVGGVGTRRIDHPGEPEVENFHRAVGTNLDVRRLQIAVDDSDSVRRLETGRDLGGNTESFVERQRPSGQRLIEPFSLDQLEDEVESALRLLDAVQGCEVRVVQRTQEAGLALEPRPPFLVARERIGKGLERHLSPEPRVPRPVHLPHSARANRRDDLVRAQAGPGCEGHGKRQLAHGFDNLARCT